MRILEITSEQFFSYESNWDAPPPSFWRSLPSTGKWIYDIYVQEIPCIPRPKQFGGWFLVLFPKVKLCWFSGEKCCSVFLWTVGSLSHSWFIHGCRVDSCMVWAWNSPIENMLVKVDHETPRIGVNIKNHWNSPKVMSFFPLKKCCALPSTGFKGWSASTDSMPADVSQVDQLPEENKTRNSQVS